MVDFERTLIIGDVHGCASELATLLNETDANPTRDRILFVGDLINKGPSTKDVWQIFRSLGATSILGNHEMCVLDILAGRASQHRRFLDDLERTFGEHLNAFVEDVKHWPLWLEEEGLWVVHAGLVPGKHPRDCDPWTLVTIRTWDGEGRDLHNRANPAWFDLYDDDALVVFGHWAALGGVNKPKVVGLDTGCVYGGMLSCLVLPERRFVRVKARKAYCPVRH